MSECETEGEKIVLKYFVFVFIRISVLIQRCYNTVDNTVNRQTLHDEFAAVKVHCRCTVKHCTFLMHDPTNVNVYCNMQLGKEESTLQVVYY